MRKNLELVHRLAYLFGLRPSAMRSAVRMQYRHQVGIPFDRRLRQGKSGLPTNLSLCLTYRCNLKCVMCRQYRETPEGFGGKTWYDSARELPLDAWVNVLRQVEKFRPWLYLTGGECTLYPHFTELVLEAKAGNFLVQVQTNGTLLARHAEFLVSSGVEIVTVSLDGPRDVHDRIRGVAGTFDALKKGAEALVEARRRHGAAGPILSFNFTISKPNYEYMAETVEEAIKMNGDFIQIQHTMFNSYEKVEEHNSLFHQKKLKELGLKMVLPSIGEGGFYQSGIGLEDIAKLLEQMDKAREIAQGRIKAHFMPDIPRELVGPYYLDLDHPFLDSCASFWKTLRVEPDGTVSPCLNLLLGNVREESVEGIWNGPSMQNARNFVRQGLPPGCRRCCQRHYSRAGRAF